MRIADLVATWWLSVTRRWSWLAEHVATWWSPVAERLAPAWSRPGTRWALEPREWRFAGALAATVLTALTLASVWWPASTWAGSVSSGTQVVGTCHAFVTDAELDSFSDVRPPVPCTSPHQTETAADGVLTGELAAGTERMRPEKRVMIMGDLCREPVRDYTGAGPRDELWRVDTLLRLPTAAEWAAGDRRYRCELAPRTAAGLPRASRSLRGILDTPAGAAYRRCWTDVDAAVPCDEPHRAESVNAIAPVPPERRADPPDALHAWADPVCAATVSEFLRTAVEKTPYRSVARLIGADVIECGVAFPAGEPMRAGTLALTGTEPVK